MSDYGKIKFEIWGDSKWRSLSTSAQWLYQYMLSAPNRSMVGVVDWRPVRIATLSSGATRASVEKWGAELEAADYIVIDAETEEAAIRSFLRHDIDFRNQNLYRSIGQAFAGIASTTLMCVVAHELRRLESENPGGFETKDGRSIATWDSEHLAPILAFDTPSDTPSYSPSDTPSRPPLPTTTTTTTTTRVSDSEFEIAWSHWPKHTERAKSFEKFSRVAKQRGLDVLTADVIRFGDAYARTTEKKYVPALVVWLNRERWTDELPSSGGNAPAYVPESGKPPEGQRWAVDVMEDDFDVLV